MVTFPERKNSKNGIVFPENHRSTLTEALDPGPIGTGDLLAQNPTLHGVVIKKFLDFPREKAFWQNEPKIV